MIILFPKKKLDSHGIEEVIDILKKNNRVIFSIDLSLCTENFSLNAFIEGILLLSSLQI